jgi:integrase
VSIDKRKNGSGQDRFDVRYRGPDGKQRSKTFRTRRDARAFESELAVQMRKGVWTDPKAGRVRLSDWAAEWEATTVHLAASSRRIHADNLRLHVLPDVIDHDGKKLAEGLGGYELGKLTTAQLTKWVAALSRKPTSRQPKAKEGETLPVRRLAAGSVHQAYRTLHLCLEAAVTCGHIGRNPLDGVKPPRLEAKPMKFLDAGQVEALADAIEPRYRALVLVGAYCGLRIGELVALRWENVDPLARSIKVIEQADPDQGRGAVKPPKTAAGRRSVQVPSFVVDALVAHGRLTQAESDGVVPALAGEASRAQGGGGGGLRLVGGTGGHESGRGDEAGEGDNSNRPDLWRGLVFRSADGGPIDVSNFRSREWLGAVKAADLGHLRIHDLRHTCASLAIAAGADVKVLQRMLGHASAAVTLDRYGHLMPGQSEAVADRLDLLRETALAAAR